MNQIKKHKVYHKGIINWVKNSRESTLGWAFTLVELIVVITILAILWTIAFISLQWYSRDARDSVRQSDIANLTKSLALYETQRGVYPEPTLWIDITFSWWQIWNQWTLWDSVIINLDKLNKKSVDPLTWTEYTYSVLNTRKEYEIASVLEWWVSQTINLINQAEAAWILVWVAYVKWNYNWMVAKVNTWAIQYVLAVPTIISWDILLTDIVDIMQSWALVYNWAANLPSNYRWTNFNVDWWWFSFTVSDIVAYTWTIDSLSDLNNQITLIDNLKTIYTWTDAIKNQEIQKLVNTTINTTTPSDEVKIFASSIIKQSVNSSIPIYTPTITAIDSSVPIPSWSPNDGF